MDMSHAFEALYGIGGIGEKEGIVGYLTDNRLTRETLILESRYPCQFQDLIRIEVH